MVYVMYRPIAEIVSKGIVNIKINKLSFIALTRNRNRNKIEIAVSYLLII